MKAINFIVQTLLIICTWTAHGQDNYTMVNKSFSLTTSEVQIKNDYADQIRLHTYSKDSIRVSANVLLVDEKGKSKNEDFDITFNKSGSVSKLTFEIKSIKANYVFKKTGSDFDPKTSKLYKADKALLVGTEIDIYIPRGINIELESDMGDLAIDHNDGNLIVTTGNNVTLIVNKDLHANMKLKSQHGKLKISKNLYLKKGASAGDYHDLSSYVLNQSGVEISVIAFDDIIVNPKN